MAMIRKVLLTSLELITKMLGNNSSSLSVVRQCIFVE